MIRYDYPFSRDRSRAAIRSDEVPRVFHGQNPQPKYSAGLRTGLRSIFDLVRAAR